MIKILAIGNSFSQDATAYLHEMAKCAGFSSKIVNLCIGGCSLKQHMENVENDACVYGYELNGMSTGRQVSLKEVLLEDNWSVITMQQASPYSGLLETYFPYLEQLSEYIRKYQPTAVQMLHQTWAYEHDCSLEFFDTYDKNQLIMYNSLKKANENAAKKLNLKLIPSGDVIQKLRELETFDYKNGGLSLCRDGFHMHLIYGRYAIAATWYESIFNCFISENSFIPSDMEIDDVYLITQIKQNVREIIQKNNKIASYS